MSHHHQDDKDKQLNGFSLGSGKGCPVMTSWGVKVSNDDVSLKPGPRGPGLLEDFHLLDKITHFDHERIPERVVHARGAAAHGFFQVYKSQEHLTKAGFLCDPNIKTPVFLRFSTVLGSRGSADTVRDVRGFAVKFYTQEGNFDLVGNNMPVFFIQEAMKFPDLIHAGKPEPYNEVPQAQTAHDNFWDFISLTPESMHMIMWAMSDKALPRSYRMMQGFGVHSFALVNKEGKRRFVKFHWRPILGTHSMTWEEYQKVSGLDPDFHRKDLWESIESGNFPEWELGLQIVEEEDENKFDFDILDATKIIPEELVPVQYIGKMTLNRNPTDFFAETEQVAFCTRHLVPGIDFTNDPLLQGRNFSYQDTQITRLGGPNWTEIPINRPLCPVFNNQRDGFMRQTISKDRVNYFPNRFGTPAPTPAADGGFESFRAKIEGMKERLKGPKFADHYSQATLFFNSMTPVEQDHIVAAAIFELSHVEDEGVQKKIVEHFSNIHPVLCKRVAEGLGLEAPAAKAIDVSQKSAALSLFGPYATKGTGPESVGTRKVGIVLADGFDSDDLKAAQAAFKAAGIVPAIIAQRAGHIKGSKGDSVKADFALFSARSVLFDGTLFIGGSGSAQTLGSKGETGVFINETFRHCKPLGATGESVDLLRTLGTLPGVKLAQAADVVSDQGVVTSSGKTADAIKAFIEAMGEHRFWTRDTTKVPA